MPFTSREWSAEWPPFTDVQRIRQVRLVILADSWRTAHAYAQRHGYRTGRWYWPTRFARLAGYASVDWVLLPSWVSHPDAHELQGWVSARLSSEHDPAPVTAPRVYHPRPSTYQRRPAPFIAAGVVINYRHR
jgi:hypothetical protein